MIFVQHISAHGFDGETLCLRPYTQLKGVLFNISIAMDFSDAICALLEYLGDKANKGAALRS